MRVTSPNPGRWPAFLLLAAAICPPLATWLSSMQGFTIHGVTDNPWLVFGFFLLYELFLIVLGIAVKIWQRLEGSWLDLLSQAVDRFVRRLLAGYHQQYRLFFYYEHRDLDVKGLSTQGTYTLDLEQVYVELSMDSKPPHQVSTNPLSVPKIFREGSHGIWDYLSSPLLQNQHLVILGPPGSGKTTLVKYVALTLLHRRKTIRKKRLSKLPLLLYLRDHSATISAEDSTYLLADAVRAQTAKWKRVMPPDWIERHLNRGHCLVLLDGLDEVADPQVRQQVVDWVRQQMLIYPQNRFVVTSRPFGYKTNPLEKMMILEVQPFTTHQVKQFVHSWYLANEIKSAVRNDLGVQIKAEEGAEDLLKRLQKTPTLINLAVNPLLLTMIATVHRYRGSLPGTRIMLYKEICEVLLGKRQEARGIRQELRADQRQLVLQNLAYRMMLDGVREVTNIRAREIIQETLQRVNTELTPAAFLQSIEQVSGLVLERENGVLTFAHLTFQEYLTVIHIRENHLEDMLVAQTGVSWWHEVIRLYCAQAEASRLIEACLKGAVSSVQSLILAQECLEEAREVRAEIKHLVYAMLEQWVDDRDPARRHAVVEALLGQRLRAMVPVSDEFYRDTLLITCAEYQYFLDEQQAKGKYYQPDHWETEAFELGQALQPVVGVRPSAALAFCAWLTEREVGMWQYRLSRGSECQLQEEIQIAPGSVKPVGFWIEDGKAFMWIRSSSSLLKKKNVETDQQLSPLDLDLDRVSRTEIRIREIDANTLTKILTQIYELTKSLDPAHASTLISSLDLALASGSAQVIDLAHALAHVSTLTLDLTNILLYNLDPTHDLSSDLSYPITLVRNFVHTSSGDLALDLADSLVNASIKVFNFVRFRAQKGSECLVLAQILTLLSACISYIGYQLTISGTETPSLWKRIVSILRKPLHTQLELQKIMSKSLEINRRLQQLAKRLQGKEVACEGIFIVRTRKSEGAVNVTLISKGYLTAKRIMDLLLTLLIIPSFLPVIFIIALTIRLDSHGPIFYRQKRVGRGGHEFDILKFRTMYLDSDDRMHRKAIERYTAGTYRDSDDRMQRTAAERDMAGTYKLNFDDPRITRIGRFLRTTSLDELPQFINVLRNEMSLVGPHPALPYEVIEYSIRDRLRLVGKPGLTGPWQVYGRSRTTFAEMVEMDIAYLQRKSLWEDLKLIALSALAILFFHGEGK